MIRVLGVVLALVVLYGIVVFVVQLLKALAEAAAETSQGVRNGFGNLGSWLYRRIGRSGRAGNEVEVFQPAPIALSTNYTAEELDSYKREYLAAIPPVEIPDIAVPTFPTPPDVFQVPELRFAGGSASQFPSYLIPSLLNGRSKHCSVPFRLDKIVSPDELDVPDWSAPRDFPPRPTQGPEKLPSKRTLALTLPVYTAEAGAFGIRVWLVGKLNKVVRQVHRDRVQFFEKQKQEAQDEYNAIARWNALSFAEYKARCAAWEAVRADTDLRRKNALVEYRVRAQAAKSIYQKRKAEYESQYDLASKRLDEFWARVERGQPEAVCSLFDIALAKISTPLSFPREWVLEYDAEQSILILDLRLPDFERIQITKIVALKREAKTKPVGVREQKQIAEQASCVYLLRALHEIVQYDQKRVVKAVALNGWVEYVDATTGKDRSIVIVSIFAEMDQLRGIDIERVDPVKCVSSLGGRFAGVQHGYVAIAPIVRLNRHDDRVIEGSDVLGELATGTNLAAMEWDKFEHLIRQLFEKVFAGPEVEVKVTRASRDRGVDAIIFDPDPIRGGKTVIQAKRYVNTVDLSAVRDLYGTVVNEGANKGILVTTSSFGPDAYEFAKDKNLTLLTGRELLGLLQKHGYQYRIDLEEARRLHASPPR